MKTKKSVKRKALSKKTRFEVFKRDSFACQYCGASAPDVVLHCDHIVPVKEGGDNSILNLVTACAGCNLGKGARKLSDETAVKKAKRQADELNEKLEQIQMLADWQKGISLIQEKQVNLIQQIFFQGIEMDFTEDDRIKIKKLLKRFGLNEVMEATEIAKGKYIKYSYSGTCYGIDNAISKIGGICWNRKHRNGLKDG